MSLHPGDSGRRYRHRCDRAWSPGYSPRSGRARARSVCSHRHGVEGALSRLAPAPPAQFVAPGSPTTCPASSSPISPPSRDPQLPPARLAAAGTHRRPPRARTAGRRSRRPGPSCARPPRRATRPPRRATRPPWRATRPPRRATRPPWRATRPRPPGAPPAPQGRSGPPRRKGAHSHYTAAGATRSYQGTAPAHERPDSPYQDLPPGPCHALV